MHRIILIYASELAGGCGVPVAVLLSCGGLVALSTPPPILLPLMAATVTGCRIITPDK